MPSQVEEKIDWLNIQIRSRKTWLNSHGHGTKKPWPDTDIEAKQRGLEMMQNILDDYQLSLDRASRKQEEAQ